MIKKFITLHWIYTWGGLTMLFSAMHLLLADTVWGTPTFIFSYISFLILIGGLVWKILIERKRNRQLKELFDVYAEQIPEQIEHSIIIKASPDKQPVKITLTIKAHVALVFFTLTIKGDGQKPNIIDLSDWKFDSPHDDIRYKKYPDGGWNCTYKVQTQKYFGQKIYINMVCIAPIPFNGNLEVYLSSEQGSNKHILLPFKVEGNGE